MHLLCRGAGRPTVVLEGGIGEPALTWTAVQGALAPRVRICAYDRAGYGWSAPGPSPRTAGRITTELRALLERAGLEGPYVLVGHSFGGLVAQLFARRYPALTAGLVLVDSAHPGQVERYRAALGVDIAPRRRRGLAWLTIPPPAEELSPKLRASIHDLMSVPKARRAVAEELLNFSASTAEVRGAPRPPPIPIVVLSRGARPPSEDRRAERLWQTLQAELASLSPRARRVVAARSGHDIQLAQPALVTEAVLEVARATHPPCTTLAYAP
ncbi:MAG: alpha/beta hydrolase, partial [Gammaproteobacteria bacterium]|nr:alpha/beta hydrolase [Gammaproteobacteria bacterium]